MQKITMTNKGILMARRIFKWHETKYLWHETRNELSLFQATTIAASLKKSRVQNISSTAMGKQNFANFMIADDCMKFNKTTILHLQKTGDDRY